MPIPTGDPVVKARAGDLALLAVERPKVKTLYYVAAVVSSVDRKGWVIAAIGKDGRFFNRLGGRRGRAWRKCIVAGAGILTIPCPAIVDASPEWDDPDEAVAAINAYRKGEGV